MYQELQGWTATVDQDLEKMGLPPIDPLDEIVPEEEYVMSFMLTEIEMELTLAQDYDSVIDATRTQAVHMQKTTLEFDDKEKRLLDEDGSWYNTHRETLEKHELALQQTLMKVRNKVNEGYRQLNTEIESLDFDVERAAEEELAADYAVEVDEEDD